MPVWESNRELQTLVTNPTLYQLSDCFRIIILIYSTGTWNWKPQLSIDNDFSSRDNPFDETLPGLKKPKRYYRNLETTQRNSYSQKQIRPSGPFLPARWKPPPIVFKNKTQFQVTLLKMNPSLQSSTESFLTCNNKIM